MSSSGGHRFRPITADDKGGLVWVLSLLFAVFSLLALLVRCGVRRRSFGLDDGFCAAATTAALGQYITTWCALSAGLGKTFALVNSEAVVTIARALFAGQLLYRLASCLAQCSAILLLRRLFYPAENKKMACEILCSLVSAAGVASTVVMGTLCPPSYMMRFSKVDRCAKQLLARRVLTAFNIAIEAAIFGLFIECIRKVQVSWSKKAIMAPAWGARFLLVIPIILLVHFEGAIRDASNPGVATAMAVATLQVELGCSLTVLAFLVMTAWIRTFHSNMGQGTENDTGPGSYALGAVSMQSHHQVHSLPSSVRGLLTSSHD